jgi:RimJ/RimL family protein N-acetyltransferase
VTDPLVDRDLTLRRAVPADVPDVREVYSEADTRRWMLWDDELPDDSEALANIERSEEAWAEGSWAVFRIVVDDHVVGGVNLRFADYDTAETSYFLRASARGRGLATRAVLLAADWGFRERGLARVFLRVNPENASSVALAERAGFTFEGVERQSAAGPDGRRFDSRVYSLLPAERVSIRPATLADVGFLTDAAIAASEDRGRPADDADLAAYRAGFIDWTEAQVRGEVPDSETSVVVAYGTPVGRLRVVRTAEVVELAGLQLLPAHQSRGIGTRIIGELVAEARATGRRFELSVEKDNVRAKALYERLGMVQVGETDHDLLLRLV